MDLLRIKEINLNKANVQIMKQTSFPKPPAEQIASRDHSASVSVLEDEVVGTEGHPLSIPTFIYTPSPHPLPPFINTVAPALSSGNVQHQNVDRVQPPTQGTVYTQSHAPHVGEGYHQVKPTDRHRTYILPFNLTRICIVTKHMYNHSHNYQAHSRKHYRVTMRMMALLLTEVQPQQHRMLRLKYNFRRPKYSC